MDDGLIYIAIVNVVIWLGLAFYLFSLDARVKKLERGGSNEKSEKSKA